MTANGERLVPPVTLPKGTSPSDVAIGIAIGFLVALAATRVMATLLYGVSANDLSIYAVVIALLSAAAFLASYVPARRAMKVDPMVALRYE